MSNIKPMQRGTRPNAGRPWTDVEDSHLLDYDEQGYSIEHAAVFLGREPQEVAARLEVIKPKAS